MSVLSKLFGSKAATKGGSPAEVFTGLRKMVFASKPSNFGPNGLWGVLMETAYPKGVATMVAVADGSVSVDFSKGGGILGLGGHEGPRRAASSLLEFAPRFSGQCKPTTEFPLPSVGNTRFYLIGPTTTFTAEASETDLGQGRLALSPLFHKCHELMTEIRKVDEKLKSERSSGSQPLQK